MSNIEGLVSDYRDFSELCKSNFRKIKNKSICMEISYSECVLLKSLASYISEISMKEKRGLNDKGGLETRFYYGLLGEYAVVKHLGYTFTEYFGMTISFIGGSYSNDFEDLLPFKYRVGVKTSKLGKTTKINKGLKHPQVICLVSETFCYTDIDESSWSSEDDSILLNWGINKFVKTNVFICGLLLPEYCDFYGKRDYIEFEQLRKKGTKLGFLDYDKLIDFDENIEKFRFIHNIEEVKVEDIDIKNIVYCEKDRGYFLNILNNNSKTNDTFLYHRVDSQFNRQEDIEDFLSFCENDSVLIGFGIKGYLYLLCSKYKGDKLINIKYIDLCDLLWIDGEGEEVCDIYLNWVNRLYNWVDYLSGILNTYQYKEEKNILYRKRITIDYLERYVSKYKTIFWYGCE